MRRRNAATHALLQTSTAHIIFIQEPWAGPIRTARSDTDPLGTDIIGVPHNNMWRQFLPPTDNEDVVKVVAYARTDFLQSCHTTNLLTHPLASPSCLVLDV